MYALWNLGCIHVLHTGVTFALNAMACKNVFCVNKITTLSCCIMETYFFLCNPIIYRHFNVCRHKRGSGIIKLYSSCNILLQLQSSVIILTGKPLNRIIVYSQVILQEYFSCTVCLNICYFSESKEIKISQLKLKLVFDNYHMLLFMHFI